MPKRQRKNPAAVALGRLGGLKRGETVLEKIPAAKRRMYARHAALARWAQAHAAKKQEEEKKESS